MYVGTLDTVNLLMNESVSSLTHYKLVNETMRQYSGALQTC